MRSRRARADRVGEWVPELGFPARTTSPPNSAARAVAPRAVRASRLRGCSRSVDDGTYVNGLGRRVAPGDAAATHLLQGRTVLELFQVRHCSSPGGSAGRAAGRPEVLQALRRERPHGRGRHRADELVEADAAFHDVIAGAPGNGVLRALLGSLSTRTVRARLWHGMADRKALDVAREEHARIYDAIAAGDVDLARAATLLHISDNEAWLREHLGPAEDVPLNGD